MTLRALEPEDLDLLYQIENNRELWQVGATNVPYSRYTLHDYIATSSDDIFADRQVRLIVENEQGEAVGIADLVHFDPQHQRAEVGIVILPAFRRKGYAAAAIQALCDYAIRIVVGPDVYGLPLLEEGTVSVFAATNEAHGVIERGMKYSIDDETLTNRTTRGLSNELQGVEAAVAVEEGTLFVFHPLA